MWTATILPDLPTTGEYWGVDFGDVNLDGVLDVAIASSNFGIRVYITQIRPYRQLRLEEGWNLISLPLIQTDTRIPEVFTSIDGYYEAVQYYDIENSLDPWEHYHVLKSGQNDLESVDHTQGIWIYINRKGGCDFTVYGNEINTTQSITLRPGWNLVGYPSLMDRTRDSALNNIIFGSDVNMIHSYNAETNTWEEMGPSDSFVLGGGYWIHSLVEKTWNVPL